MDGATLFDRRGSECTSASVPATNVLEPVEAREDVLDVQRCPFDLARWLDNPSLGNELFIVWELAVEPLQRLSPREEVVPRLVKARKEAAHNGAILRPHPPPQRSPSGDIPERWRRRGSVSAGGAN